MFKYFMIRWPIIHQYCYQACAISLSVDTVMNSCLAIRSRWRLPFFFLRFTWWGFFVFGVSVNAEVISAYDFLKSSILTEIQRAVQVELDNYHYLQKLCMLFHQWIFRRYEAHFTCIIEPDDRCPYETDEMGKSKDRCKATLHCSNFDDWSSNDGQYR